MTKREEKKREKKPKKKMSTIDKYLIFVFTSVVLYIAIALFIFYRTSMEPTVLTTSVFAFFGGEVTILALIKRLKLKRDGGDSDGEEGEEGSGNDKGGLAQNALNVVTSKLELKSRMSGDDDAVG